MRILVCGGRDFIDRDLLTKTLWDIFESRKTDDYVSTDEYTIIEGGAKGADELAVDFACTFGTNLESYKADWETHGKAAGPIRNKQMLEEGKPDLVIAFPGGKGTANMIKLAREANIEVRKIT